MYLDKILLDSLSEISEVKKTPENLDEIYDFFKSLAEKIEDEDYNAMLIGFVFYHFITKEEIRDRKVTSRIFEDIIAKLFNGSITDETSKENPIIPNNIKEYDCISAAHNFNISSDLSGNKREKADTNINGYNLSIKTLKGKLYNKELEIQDRDYNKELNIGSLSSRALLVGLISEEKLNELSDRKGGLGSKPQLIENVYKELERLGTWESFTERLEEFFEYVYENCDLLIAFKSGYKLELVFIEEKTFKEELIELAKTNYDDFFSVFYRWENNNVRIHYDLMFKRLMEKDKLKKVSINLNNIEKSKILEEKLNEIKEAVKEKLFVK